MPQQRSEQKRRGNELAGAHPRIGLLQRKVHETLAERLLMLEGRRAPVKPLEDKPEEVPL